MEGGTVEPEELELEDVDEEVVWRDNGDSTTSSLASSSSSFAS